MGPVLKTALLLVTSYLLGSIPTAYLAGRWLRHRDVRRYGSGTVSGSMVYEHVARWAVVPVGLFDIGKAALPTWVALRWGLATGVAVVAGMLAVIGHNWPLFLGFAGGRGLGCFMGVMLPVFPPAFPWMLAFLAVGWILGDSAPWALVGLTTMGLLARTVGGPAVVGPAAFTMLAVTLVKQLEANRRPLPTPGAERRRVVLRRLLLDRDIASHREWIRREPEGELDL
jgi:glycerol-3-phosphate acyltransferase PlsY